MLKLLRLLSLIGTICRTYFYSMILGQKLKLFGKRITLDVQGELVIGKNVIINDNVTIVVEKNARLILGDSVFLGESCYIKCYGGVIEIGDNVSINSKSFLNGAGGLYIGSNTRIGTQTVIISSNHNFSDKDKLIKDQGTTCKGVYIAENIWLGARVTVLDGAVIQSSSVIGACSLVNKKLEASGVYVGIPVRFIKEV